MDNMEVMEQEEFLPQEPQEQEQPRRHPVRAFFKWLTQLLIVTAIVVLMNLYVCRLVRVSGDSMYPTLYSNDVLMIRVLAYTPKPNDILVCATDEASTMGGKLIVKRCIATAGQTVFLDYGNNTLAVDGVTLDETYINLEEDDPMASGGRENVFYLVPEGQIFVLGDNRNHSADSRDGSIGLVRLEDVIGGVLFRIPLGMWFE